MTAEASSVPWTLIAAVIAAIASVFGVLLNVWNASVSRRREAQSEIASHRIRWIESLRELISELERLNIRFLDVDPKNIGLAYADIAQLDANIRMHLYGDEYAGFRNLLREVVMAAAQYRKDVEKNRETADQSTFSLKSAEIIQAASQLFKNEWEKAKTEIRGQAK